MPDYTEREGGDLSYEILLALHQYRNDLRWRPEPDSIERRLAMIDDLITRLGEPK